jgi:hypothetical protein
MNYSERQFVIENVAFALLATSQLVGKASFFYWLNAICTHKG